MSHEWTESASAIDDWLRASANDTRKIGGNHWSFFLSSGKAMPVTARLQDSWLLVDAPAATLECDDHWSLIIENALLPGFAKWALRSDLALRLRAEIPVDGEIEMVSMLQKTCAGFKRAATFACCLPGESESAEIIVPAAQIEEETLPPSARLNDLIAESGWEFAERSSSRWVVELESRHSFHQAVVTVEPDGSVLASVELVRWNSFTPVSRNALALLLLTACAVVRMVRAAAERTGPEVCARFEVRLPGLPSAALLDHALSALSVALRLCGREGVALADDAVARRYLALRSKKT